MGFEPVSISELEIVLRGENALRYMLAVGHVANCAECKEHLKVIDKLIGRNS